MITDHIQITSLSFKCFLFIFHYIKMKTLHNDFHQVKLHLCFVSKVNFVLWTFKHIFSLTCSFWLLWQQDFKDMVTRVNFCRLERVIWAEKNCNIFFKWNIKKNKFCFCVFNYKSYFVQCLWDLFAQNLAYIWDNTIACHGFSTFAFFIHTKLFDFVLVHCDDGPIKIVT